MSDIFDGCIRRTLDHGDCTHVDCERAGNYEYPVICGGKGVHYVDAIGQDGNRKPLAVCCAAHLDDEFPVVPETYGYHSGPISRSTI
jgi:hypothetical protein